MTEEIGLGLIGSGFMARTYAECLGKYVRGARVQAVYGGSRAPQLAADYGFAVESSLAALLNRDDIDGIIITTPETVHREQTEQTAAAGKHILVEKPMAPDAAECQAMIDSCRRAGVKLMVIQSQRFRGAHQHARTLLEQGRIGKVRQIRHWALYPYAEAAYLAESRPFYLDPMGGGLLMGFAVHCFDMVRWFAASEAVSVYAGFGAQDNEDIPELSLMAHLSFENNIIAQVWWTAELPVDNFPRSTFRTQLIGTHGLMDCDGYGSLRMNTGDGWELVWEQPEFDLKDPQDPVRLEAYNNMVQEFVDAIIEDQPPSVSGEDGLAAVALCQAAVMSARQKRLIIL